MYELKHHPYEKTECGTSYEHYELTYNENDNENDNEKMTMKIAMKMTTIILQFILKIQKMIILVIRLNN